MTKKEIGNYLKYLRLKNNYKQTDLAEMIGVSRGKLYRIESGQNYELGSLISILHIFGEQLYIAPEKGYTDHLINEVTRKLERKISEIVDKQLDNKLEITEDFIKQFI